MRPHRGLAARPPPSDILKWKSRGALRFHARRRVPRLRDGYAGRMADAAPPTPDFAIAVAQFAPGADAEANLAEITRLTELAAARGARLVVFPEYSSYFAARARVAAGRRGRVGRGPFTGASRALATELDLHVVAGMIERLDGDERRVANTVVAVAPERGGGALPQAAPLRRVRPARVRMGGAGRDRGAPAVRGRRHPLRPADLLRRRASPR